jgi:hypothetical protein
MTIDEINQIIEKINELKQLYGTVWVVLFILIAFVLIALWKFFIKRTEKIAEAISDKNLKLLQSKLDKEFFKFTMKYQKQVDAIHSIFQKYQSLTVEIKYMMTGEKFTSPIKPQDQVSIIIGRRKDFLNTYNQNRLLFSLELRLKIDKLIPTVDKFIETYVSGILPERTKEEKEFSANLNEGSYISGFWPIDAFDETIQEIDSVSKDIEIEFSKIYGTLEKEE